MKQNSVNMNIKTRSRQRKQKELSEANSRRQITLFDASSIHPNDIVLEPLPEKVKTELRSEVKQETGTSAESDTTIPVPIIKEEVDSEDVVIEEFLDIDNDDNVFQSEYSMPDADDILPLGETKLFTDTATENELDILQMKNNQEKNIYRGKSSILTEVGKGRNKNTNNNNKVHCKQCVFCERTFGNKTALDIHLRMHTCEKPFTCQTCGMSLSSTGSLRLHNLRHSKLREKTHRCDQCPKSFFLRYTLKVHQRVHTSVKPFECQHCDKRFKQSGHLQNHMKSHTGIKPHKCAICFKSFTNKRSWQLHANRHTGVKPFECSYCGNRFFHPNSFENHITLHTGNKRHKCVFCNAAYYRTSRYEDHIINHIGEKPYQCSVCGSYSKSRHCLYIHMKTHSGVKRHQCKICAELFMRECELKWHIMKYHPDSCKCSCPFCEKNFVNPAHYSRHILSHTKEKPYFCGTCQSSFSTKYNMEFHVRSEH